MSVQFHKPENNPGPHLALIAVQILFGTWAVVGKLVLKVMSPPMLVACRVTGAALVLLLLQRRVLPLLRMPRSDLAWLVLCSLIGIVGNQFLFVKGLSLTTAINTTLLSTTIPVFALFSSMLFGYDSLSFKRLAGIVLAIIGVVYLVSPHRADFTAHTTIGNLVVVSSSFLYGVYIVISKDLFERYGALNVITWIFLVGAVVSAPVGIHYLSSEHLQAAGPGTWVAVVFIVLFPTVGAYYLNAWALTKVSPGIVAVYIYFQPLIVFGLAPVVLGEKWNPRTLVAALLIFAGVAVVSRRTRTQAFRDITEHPDALAR
jgi:drug/metabolite transporter (DMT)-like permease